MLHRLTIGMALAALLAAPVRAAETKAKGAEKPKDAAQAAKPKDTAVKPGQPPLDTDDQKTMYALGLFLAQQIKGFPFELTDMDALKAGLGDGIVKKPRLQLETFGPKINDLAQSRMTILNAAERPEAETYLGKMKAEKGAVKTDSGLVFTEIKAGAGEAPKSTDWVRVQYRGTLRDGTVFDSTAERGEPAKFPLNGVIPCWTEALQKMKVGGKAKVTCPPNIAYGDKGSLPEIRPGAALTFDVELLSIEPPPPQAQPGMPPGHP